MGLDEVTRGPVAGATPATCGNWRSTRPPGHLTLGIAGADGATRAMIAEGLRCAPLRDGGTGVIATIQGHGPAGLRAPAKAGNLAERAFLDRLRPFLAPRTDWGGARS